MIEHFLHPEFLRKPLSGINYTSQKVRTSEIFRWKHELSMQEIEDIQDICGKTLQRLGYNFIQRPEDTSDENFDILLRSDHILKIKDKTFTWSIVVEKS